MKARQVPAVLVLCLMMGIVPAATATAEAPVPATGANEVCGADELLKKYRTRFETINRYSMAMWSAGMTENSIDHCLNAVLGLVRWTKITTCASHVRECTKSAVDKVCITLPTGCQWTNGSTSTTSTMSTASTDDDVFLSPPRAYYDPRGNEYSHVVIGRWEYQKRLRESVGGLDGMGVAIQDVKVGESALLWKGEDTQGDDCTLFYDYTPSERSRTNGVVHREQDQYESYCGYTWHWGQISMRFNIYSCDGLLFDTKLGHTWSSTSLTGASISASTTGVGISFSFDSTSNHWETTPAQPSKEYPPCSG